MEKENKQQSNRIRSSAYPYIDLEQAINLTKTVMEKLGEGPYDRNSASEAIGHPTVTGASSSKIAAMSHYGLLDRKNNAYSLSKLAREILLPRSEEEKGMAIRVAVKTPSLYRSLIRKYSNKGLPSLLKNIVVHEMGINKNVSEKVVENFQKSLIYAGILVNGIITDDEETQEEVVEEESMDPRPQEAIQTEKKQIPVNSNPGKYQTVRLPSGIVIFFPEEMSFNLVRGEFKEGVEMLEKKASENQFQQ